MKVAKGWAWWCISVIPATLEVEVGGLWLKSPRKKHKTLSEKPTISKRTEDVTQVVEDPEFNPMYCLYVYVYTYIYERHQNTTASGCEGLRIDTLKGIAGCQAQGLSTWRQSNVSAARIPSCKVKRASGRKIPQHLSWYMSRAWDCGCVKAFCKWTGIHGDRPRPRPSWIIWELQAEFLHGDAIVPARFPRVEPRCYAGTERNGPAVTCKGSAVTHLEGGPEAPGVSCNHVYVYM
jgi:hypothetical protein